MNANDKKVQEAVQLLGAYTADKARIDGLMKGVTDKLVAECAPVKVGEQTVVNVGWRHEGKMMEIEEVSFVGNHGKWFWQARGAVLKKDGSKSCYKGLWHGNMTFTNDWTPELRGEEPI